MDSYHFIFGITEGNENHAYKRYIPNNNQFRLWLDFAFWKFEFIIKYGNPLKKTKTRFLMSRYNRKFTPNEPTRLGEENRIQKDPPIMNTVIFGISREINDVGELFIITFVSGEVEIFNNGMV